MIAVVEMPLGTRYKYEIDKSDNKLIVDRLIPIPCPYNYGFIPETLSPDGDPLDIFIISEEPVAPTTKIRVKIVDVVRCIDNGEEDDKIIAVVEGDLPEPGLIADSIEKIKDYLETYKQGVVLKPNDRDPMQIIKEAGDKYSRQMELYGPLGF
jgi:inorganic pyrophosphatase